MKRTKFFTVIATAVVLVSCGGGNDKPGKIYMPDMTYSRAVETYALLDSTKYTNDPAQIGEKIFYNSKPVIGTMSTSDLPPYTLSDDSAGYAQSAMVKNPLPPLDGKDSAEASRLFNINCAICHGAEGKANGPLATSGKVGGIVNLTLDQYVKLADGTMYHSINYGKNNMGSYASQLSSKQRWQIIQYVRMLQPKATATEAAATTTAPAADSSAAAKKTK
ncbi:MAG: cytochrome c [Chitinophagaceae bacterium]|nr:cytochrome c [Chitinophagaceae bacterium]